MSSSSPSMPPKVPRRRAPVWPRAFAPLFPRPGSAPVDVAFDFAAHGFPLADPAGIRRAGKIQGWVEYYTVLRAERAVERSDVDVLVVDAAEGIADGDKRVGGLSRDAGKGCVIFVN